GADGMGAFHDEAVHKAQHAAEEAAAHGASPAEQEQAAKDAVNEVVNEHASQAKPAPLEAPAEEPPAAHADPAAVAKGGAAGEQEALPKIEQNAEAQTKAAVAPVEAPPPAEHEGGPVTTPKVDEHPQPGPVVDTAEAQAAKMVGQAVEESTSKPPVEAVK